MLSLSLCCSLAHTSGSPDTTSEEEAFYFSRCLLSDFFFAHLGPFCIPCALCYVFPDARNMELLFVTTVPQIEMDVPKPPKKDEDENEAEETPVETSDEEDSGDEEDEEDSADEEGADAAGTAARSAAAGSEKPKYGRSHQPDPEIPQKCI